MYLMYIDESEKDNYSDGLNYYNLVGIIVNEKDWVTVDNALTKLKIEFFPNIPPEKIEFHAKEIRNGNNIYSHIDNEKRKELFKRFFEVLKELPISIISILVNKSEIIKKQIRFNPIAENSWKYLLERFDNFVIEGNKKKGNEEFGLLIIDSEGERYDTELRALIRKIIKSGTSYHTDFKNIVEDALFTYSHWRNLTQIADMVAYCIVKYKESNELFKECFLNLEDKFRKNGDGRYAGYGLKIIPRDL